MLKRALIVGILALGLTGTANAGPPFLNIEGEGGGGISPWAYLINPPEKGKMIGKPSIAAWQWIGNGYNFTFQSIAMNLFNRVELGFGVMDLDISEMRDDLFSATTLDLNEDHVRVFHIHAKVLALNESEYIPAVAFSAGYKWNTEMDELDKRLGGVFSSIGYDNDSSAEFTAVATKTIPWAIPTIVSAGVRLSRGHQLGLLGFSNKWSANFESTIAILPSEKVAVGFEYKQKPDRMQSLGSLGLNTGRQQDFTFREDDFIDWFFCYMPTSKLSFIIAWATIGNVIHTEVESIFAFNVKLDF